MSQPAPEGAPGPDGHDGPRSADLGPVASPRSGAEPGSVSSRRSGAEPGAVSSGPPAAPAIRASDAERERVAEVVRAAVTDGRLTLAEGDERLRDAYAALYRRDLVPLTADLEPPGATGCHPVDAAAAGAPAGPVDRLASTTSIAALSGVHRRGTWTPGRTHRVVAFWGGGEFALRDARLGDGGLTFAVVAIMGGVSIDLRGVPARSGPIAVQVVAIMGGAEVVVDPDTTVHEDGLGLLGAFVDDTPAPRRDDGLAVRVTGVAIMGGVLVSRKPLAVRRGEDGRALESG